MQTATTHLPAHSRTHLSARAPFIDLPATGETFATPMEAYARIRDELNPDSTGLFGLREGYCIGPTSRFYHKGYEVAYPNAPFDFVRFGGARVEYLAIYLVDCQDAGWAFIYCESNGEWRAAVTDSQDANLYGEDQDSFSLPWFLKEWFR